LGEKQPRSTDQINLSARLVGGFSSNSDRFPLNSAPPPGEFGNDFNERVALPNRRITALHPEATLGDAADVLGNAPAAARRPFFVS